MSGSDAIHSTVFAEIQQFLGDFFHELDNNGLNATDFYWEDGVFEVGGKVFQGLEGVRKFYADRLAQVKATPSGVRTSRHTYVNLRIAVIDRDHADTDFINLTYAGEGSAPVMNLNGPSVVSDVRMACRRGGDGRWRIKRFTGAVAFMGSDPLIQKITLKP